MNLNSPHTCYLPLSSPLPHYTSFLFLPKEGGILKFPCCSVWVVNEVLDSIMNMQCYWFCVRARACVCVCMSLITAGMQNQAPPFNSISIMLREWERARLRLLDSSKEIAAQMSWKTANPSDLADSVTMRTADISIVMACSSSHLLHPFD